MQLNDEYEHHNPSVNYSNNKGEGKVVRNVLTTYIKYNLVVGDTTTKIIDTVNTDNSKDGIDAFLKYRCVRYLTGYY